MLCITHRLLKHLLNLGAILDHEILEIIFSKRGQRCCWFPSTGNNNGLPLHDITENLVGIVFSLPCFGDFHDVPSRMLDS